MKIMLVDDEPGILRVERIILEKAGYEVVEASSGEECLEKLKSVKPDLILMDVMMPEMDGWEATRIIKEDDDTKNIPVVIVTVKDSDDEKTRSYMYSHADGHLVKPLSMGELLETVSWVFNFYGKKIKEA
ncbi:response regulator [archaeon]|nr:response regulator [archaeon]